jgi:5'-deoxynucleotidase YfbR-like HD superfamily hydrolase
VSEHYITHRYAPDASQFGGDCAVCGHVRDVAWHTDATKPQPKFLKNLFSVVHDMSAVQRFSRIRMVHPERVLEHTGMVCTFAYAIGRLLQTKAHRELKPLDMGAVLGRAVMHDMDETITGDIVRPTKYFSDLLREELRRLEAKGIDNISTALDLHVMTGDFMRSKQGREGYIVKLADVFAALCTVYIEVRVCGNLAMVQPAANLKRLIASLRPANSGKWNAEEIALLDVLLDEALLLVNEVTALSSPLVSLHGEM